MGIIKLSVFILRFNYTSLGIFLVMETKGFCIRNFVTDLNLKFYKLGAKKSCLFILMILVIQDLR